LERTLASRPDVGSPVTLLKKAAVRMANLIFPMSDVWLYLCVRESE
jgi:hypothetical protein